MEKHKFHQKISFDITGLFDLVRMAQSWNEQLPDKIVPPDQMMRDDVRAEAAAFMQDGGQTTADLDGLIKMSENNGICVVMHDDVSKFFGDRYPVGYSTFIKNASGRDVAMMMISENRSNYTKMYTCTFEAGHCYLGHRDMPPQEQENRNLRGRAKWFADNVNARAALWKIDYNMRNGKPIYEALPKFSLCCAMNALQDKDGVYSFSPQSIFMVRAAIDSVAPMSEEQMQGWDEDDERIRMVDADSPHSRILWVIRE